MDSAPDPGLEHVLISDPLGPGLIGERVVVRYRVIDEVGPTGGPAFTDVLGVLESWADGRITVRRRDDSIATIEIAWIVSGKAIPPPPMRRGRALDSGEEISL